MSQIKTDCHFAEHEQAGGQQRADQHIAPGNPRGWQVFIDQCKQQRDDQRAAGRELAAVHGVDVAR